MRRLLRRLTGALLCVLFLAATPRTALAAGDAPTISAKGAILIEAASGRVLFEQNADRVLEPASTTKIMTAILAIEAGDLDRIVTVSERAAKTEGSSLYLKAGETLPLIELVYGLMLQSGNDAAVAIAEAVAGSVEDFVSQMNEKAQSLGLNDTHFANPNGLHAEGHATTARELCKIAAYAMQNETFRAVVATQARTAENGSVAHTFRNKNKFLSQYEGCNGVKTGYTKAAGKCLVFAANRDGMQLIGVVLSDPKMWDDARTLLDYGFRTFELRRVVSADEVFTVKLEDAEKNALPVAAKQDILYPIRSDGSETLSAAKSLPDALSPPIRAGDTVGTVTVSFNGTVLTTAPLVALESVSRKTFRFYWEKALALW
ncbi:MAG: D-alanyl-D-alanine carboxypeptidase [Clostridia bacterium]|nr:D-alanyl-D-alanine carboxypeptidase [Clostridia bacterium]